MEGYPIPLGEVEIELKVKNSRFLGFLAPIGSPQGAKDYIAAIRQRHAGASHYVYAFAVGYGASVVHGMSDDGEPSGTAGRPVLAVLRGADLGDAVVVVVRYFGGTKLGTGGLVKAYTQAAQAAIEAATRGLRIEETEVAVDLPYEWYGRCRLAIEACEGELIAEDFAGQVGLRVRIAVQRLDGLQRELQELTNGRVVLRRS